jgi:ribose transport system substrate-binding protein
MRVRQVLTTAACAALLVASALLLAACGSSSDSSSSGSGAGGVKPKIAVVSFAGSEYFAGYNRGFENEAKKLGLEVEVQNSPSFETSAATATINAAVATNPDYLVVSAVESTALRQPLLAASERGIKVITYDTQVEDPSFVITYVNADYHEYGVAAGRELGRVVGGKGKVMLEAVLPGNLDFEEFEEGFSESLPPGVTELPVQYGQAENSKSAQITRATLTREPDLAGLSATSAFGGEGMMSALKEAGKIGTVKAELLSATPYAIEALRKGEVQVVIAEQLEKIGEAAIKAAYDDANGKELPEKIKLPICTITKATINDPKNAACIQ